ncbi:MAG: hypothetical protein ACOVOO_00080, partial [Flavobacteriales bacterium]
MAFKPTLSLVLMFILCQVAIGQKRYVVFANGYKGFKHDKETTANDVDTLPDSYWMNYDDTLMKRFAGAKAIYIDGHHPINTTPHRTKTKAISSYLVTRFAWLSRGPGWAMNDTPNPIGFNVRFHNGQLCGLTFCKDFLCSDKRDTIDIVCHSMGYAYALGFLDAVDEQMILGKILILAPESPSVMGYDWNRFQQVWQIGSNRLEPHADRVCQQDGIAPQSAVKNIESLDVTKGGRVFLPQKAPRGFIRSHHLNWWQWLLEIKKG